MERNRMFVSNNVIGFKQCCSLFCQALLAFEEQQGAVMAKNTLSKAEIERLPVKTYDPSHSAGKTE